MSCGLIDHTNRNVLLAHMDLRDVHHRTHRKATWGIVMGRV